MRLAQPSAIWLVAALALVLFACAEASNPVSGSSEPPPTLVNAADCGSPATGPNWSNQAQAEARLIGEESGLDVYAVEYPLPGPTEGLWSQWGQGVVGSDGRHYSAVGDHLGVDGNSYFFEYDPSSRVLTRFMDALSVVDRPSGSWGFGKVHAQMVLDPCGRVWAATYWGTRRDIQSYDGDHLLVIDPAARTVSDEGIVLSGHGIPSMVAAGNGAIAAEAVEPESDKGALAWAEFDEPDSFETVVDPDHVGFRSLASDSGGRVLYSVGSRTLMAWDPTDDSTDTFTKELPGDWLRAATPVDSEGLIYGVTQDDPVLFAMDSSGDVERLGDPGGYTTSIALDDAGDRLFWLAGAHGSSWASGATIKQLDLGSGRISDVVSLVAPFRDELGLLPGGTYSMVYDEGKLFVGVNASEVSDDSGFGTVVFLVVEGL